MTLPAGPAIPHPIDPDRRRARAFACFWVFVVLAVLLVSHAVLVPFVLASLLAYVLSPVVSALTRRHVRGRPVARWAAVLGLYACLLLTLGLSLRYTVPLIAGEARALVRDELPRLANEVRTDLLPRLKALGDRIAMPVVRAPDGEPVTVTGEASEESERALRIEPVAAGGYRVLLPPRGIAIEQDSNGNYRVRDPFMRDHDESRGDFARLYDHLRLLGAGHTTDVVAAVRGIVVAVVGGVFGFFITLMLSAYILLTERSIVGFARSLVAPSSRASFDELLARMDRGLSGVVRGQLIICGVNGVLTAIGFGFLHLEYWPLLAVFAACFSLVPIFGSILSTVPALIIALQRGTGTAVLVLAWIVLIHQLEANVLNPKIMGDAARIHPVLVVFSLLAGEHFFGILGALLAVPVMSLVQSIFLHWRKHALAYGDARIATDSFTPTELR